MKIICFCGPHNSGKTTLIKNLTQYLSEKGVKVSILKSTKHNKIFLPDGKDSTEFLKISQCVGVISNGLFTMFYKKDISYEELPYYFCETTDVLIIEGLKRSNFRKIAVFNKYDPEFWKDITNIVAVVSNDSDFEGDVKRFSYNDVESIANFILSLPDEDSDCKLFCNGKNIKLKPFVKKVLKDTIYAFVSNLKGCSQIKSVVIRIIDRNI